jgi:hypothetical protein
MGKGNDDATELFSQSRKCPELYPENSVRTESFKHKLEYLRRFLEQENVLTQTEGAIAIGDIVKGQNSSLHHSSAILY